MAKKLKLQGDPEIENELGAEPGAEVSTLVALKIEVPAIPDVLNINGVEVSEDLIKQKIAELKLIKIADCFDEENIEKLAEAKKRILKLRTGSKTWRENLMKPVNSFGKDLKAKIDRFGELCAEGEKAADDMMIPIEKELEELRTKKAREAEAEFQRRVGLLIANGAVTTDGSSFSFPHDTNLEINAVLLKEMELDVFEAEFTEIEASWKKEVARLDKIKADKEAEEAAFKAQIATLNEKRTKVRRKELKYDEFEEIEPGVWSKNDVQFTEDDILTLEDEIWESRLDIANEMVAPDMPEEEPQVISPIASGNLKASSASSGDWKPRTPLHTLGAEFADEFEEVIVEEAPEPVKVEAKVFTRSFVFTETNPYVEFEVITGKFLQRIFPVEFATLASISIADGSILNAGAINDQLAFIVFKK